MKCGNAESEAKVLECRLQVGSGSGVRGRIKASNELGVPLHAVKIDPMSMFLGQCMEGVECSADNK